MGRGNREDWGAWAQEEPFDADSGTQTKKQEQEEFAPLVGSQKTWFAHTQCVSRSLPESFRFFAQAAAL